MKKERIVVLGGGGYIGSALCASLCCTYDTPELVVLDKRFSEVVVNQLNDFARTRPIHYVEADVADRVVVGPLIKSAAIVFIVNGEVGAEGSWKNRDLMWEENYTKIQSFLPLINREARVVFCSTANMFGGSTYPPSHIFTEDDLPCPRFPYAESKGATEQMLLESGMDVQIGRLGTAYGFSPMIRFNLVVNLFVKRALQGLPLTLHGKGENFRPFTGVQDLARALTLLGDRSRFQDGQQRVWHVAGENLQIRDVAQRVATEVPGTTIVEIESPAPFESYALSSQRLLDQGFHFYWSVDKGIRNLVSRYGVLKP